jgi:excisionase family DNA binding protein
LLYVWIGPRVLILDLDRGAALHLAVALDLHRRTCRANGTQVPSELAELAKTCWSRAKGDDDRQAPTNLAEIVQGLQGGPVPLLIDVPQAAEVLGVSSRQVERLVASGELASVKVGAARRIRRADLDRYVDNLAPGPFGSRVVTKSAPAPRVGSSGPGGRLGGGQ